MKLTNLELSNFMIFNHLDMNFSAEYQYYQWRKQYRKDRITEDIIFLHEKWK